MAMLCVSRSSERWARKSDGLSKSPSWNADFMEMMPSQISPADFNARLGRFALQQSAKFVKDSNHPAGVDS